MYIIIIRQFKKKIFILTSLLLLFFLSYYMLDLFLTRFMILNITINDYLTFSYPLKYQVGSIYVNDQLKNVDLVVNYTYKKPDTIKFSNYKSLKGKFSFNYPSAFSLDEKYFSGSDILYHIDFFNKRENTHGFIQVWNQPYSLEEFLKNSKETSHLNFIEFTSKEVHINNNPGFYWDYAVKTDEGREFKGSEVFFKKDDLMYRISYFTPLDKWNKKNSEIFWSIVKSFKTY
ncbi:MAG TPA: hypothetical protein GXX20_08905 [Clostridiaceae bacterium]|nr:hypothetical protein [Clostridiaceae bacterium]